MSSLAVPEITGTLLSSMLISMQDLGDLGKKLLALNGVPEIDAQGWYPRQVQHNCFSELERRMGSRALSAVGFAYQNIIRAKFKEQIDAITAETTRICANPTMSQDAKVGHAVQSAGQLQALLNSGSKVNVRNHPDDYGFYFEQLAPNRARASFSSFAVPAITPYCRAIIYGLLRLTLPPNISLTVELDTTLAHRAAGAPIDHFTVHFGWQDSDLGHREMQLSETLKMKEELLRAALEAAERAEETASRALAHHMDSVNYASRIQRGLLAPREDLARRLKAYGVLWEPRDLIGGDIYWMTPHSDEDFTIALIDCTGHGVPGALLSMLVSSTLERVYQIDPDIDPGTALARLGDLIRSLLKQDKPDADSRDGFDAAMVRIHRGRGEITFAGARTGLFILPQDLATAPRRIPGERRALGYAGVEPHAALPNHVIPIAASEVFVLVSDGVIDQVGDERRIAFGNTRLTETLAEHRGLPPQALMDHLMARLLAWQGSQERRDDVSAFAFTL